MSQRDFTLYLTAGVPQQIAFPGSMYHITEATSPVQLVFDNGDRITRSRTMGGQVFRYFEVEVSSIVDQEVTITLGEGVMSDSRAVVTGNVSATVENANKNTDASDVTVPAGTTVQVISVNSKRKQLLIFAGENNIENLRVGGPNTDATHGAILAPGGNGALETEAAVFVFNPGLQPETVSLLELERV